ncbi:MAG: 4Fe-4S dicluster domain-containing protein [Myxococcaceae bacterium]
MPPLIPGREFPEGADQTPAGVSRRQALELAAFTAAMGLTSCFRPAPEELVPYWNAQPGVPGVPQHYATTLEFEGFDRGLLITTYEHRPVKVEGNPRHPASLGAAGAHEQAALLGLFDSTRARASRLNGKAATRAELLAALRAKGARTDGGAGLRLLIEPSASPHRASLVGRVLERFPKAKVVPFSATLTGREQEGARLAFGRPLRVVHHFDRARTVVSLDAELLATLPGEPRWPRDWVDSRSANDDARLWVAEASSSVTGMFSDQRLRSRLSRLPSIARALAAEVGRALGQGALKTLEAGVELTLGEARWVSGAAKDLVAHRGAAHVVVSERLPAPVHALGHLLDEALGACGGPAGLIAEPLHPSPDPVGCHALAGELRAGAVDTLIVTAWNPVACALPELELAEALGRAELSIYCGLHDDETAKACSSFAAAAHPLEGWGDGRGRDGTAAIRQPVIAPLFEGLIEPDELLAVLAGDERPALERLRASRPAEEHRWRSWLADGVIAGSAPEPVGAGVDAAKVLEAVRALPVQPTSALELSFVPDLKIFDGRFWANPWLQELPDPVTKLTWDNAALLSPATAKSLGVETGRRVRLAANDAQLEVPVLVVQGHPDGTLTLPLGYGRDEIGICAQPLRSIGALWSVTGVRVTPLPGEHAFAITQDHWSMEGRELALRMTRDELENEPARLERLREEKPHLYPVAHAEQKPPQHRWGMAIDLDRCTGCSACVIACQAENNIPAVGKENVRKGREMQWLRIDRYFIGDDDPVAVTQPLMCVHCEYAPCEYVCPVFATVHSDEGLNQMVYNRCVGTRYCSNNCPYKVRRFNYLEYTPKEPFARARQNPEVTVRSRGVMEKCSYCVQRIEAARISARNAGRAIRDGEIVTACQQACPTTALVFGDLADPGSRVSGLHDDGRAYRLLNDLGTQPRTMHLARLVHEVEP